MTESIETFKPRLAPGILIPFDDKIIYEKDSDHRRIMFPIQSIDFLLLCDGRRSVRDIVDKLYREQGRVHFKTMFDMMIELYQGGFIENSHQLTLPKDSIFEKTSWFNSSWFNPAPKEFWVYNLTRKIELSHVSTAVFYVFSIVFIILGILSLQSYSLDSVSGDFLLLDGSYAYGALFLLTVTSLLIGLKNILKGLLLLLLSGRVYNLRFSWSGFFFYPNLDADSLYLVSNKMYTLLFQLCISLSYFVFGWFLQTFLIWTFESVDFGSSISIIVFYLTLMGLSPLFKSDLLDFLQVTFEHETFLRISRFLKNRDLLQVLQSGVHHVSTSIKLFSYFYIFLWSGVGVSFFLHLFQSNYELLKFTLLTDTLWARASSSLIFLFLMSHVVFIVSHVARFIHRRFLKDIVASMKLVLVRKKKVIKEFDENSLMQTLSSLPLFSYFNPSLLKELIHRSTLEIVDRNDVVIREGDVGKHIFVLLGGELISRKQDDLGEGMKESQLLPVTIFGELAVFEEVPRQASVLAAQESVVLKVPAQDLRTLATNSGFVRELSHFTKSIIASQYFNSAPVFRDVNRSVKEYLLSKGKFEEFKHKQVVFYQGSSGTNFYLILRGAVDILVNDVLVNTIQQGGFFGEIAVIARLPRTATVVANGPTTVFSISSDAFWEAISQDMELAMVIESVGEMRFKYDLDYLK